MGPSSISANGCTCAALSNVYPLNAISGNTSNEMSSAVVNDASMDVALAMFTAGAPCTGSSCNVATRIRGMTDARDTRRDAVREWRSKVNPFVPVQKCVRVASFALNKC